MDLGGQVATDVMDLNRSFAVRIIARVTSSAVCGVPVFVSVVACAGMGVVVDFWLPVDQAEALKDSHHGFSSCFFLRDHYRGACLIDD